MSLRDAERSVAKGVRLFVSPSFPMPPSMNSLLSDISLEGGDSKGMSEAKTRGKKEFPWLGESIQWVDRLESVSR